VLGQNFAIQGLRCVIFPQKFHALVCAPGNFLKSVPDFSGRWVVRMERPGDYRKFFGGQNKNFVKNFWYH
jgi:hypothetical protein